MAAYRNERKNGVGGWVEFIKSGERQKIRSYRNTLNILINNAVCQVMLTKLNTLKIPFKSQCIHLLSFFFELQGLPGEALSYEIHSTTVI